MDARKARAACCAVVLSCALHPASALAADKPLSLDRAQHAASKDAQAKGRARYPYDVFTVTVRLCSRDSRFQVSCKAFLQGTRACVATECAARTPGFYVEQCTWKARVTSYGRRHRQVRVVAQGFACKLGDEVPDPDA